MCPPMDPPLQTRWVEQADALAIFTELYDSVLQALGLITQCSDGNTSSSASVLLTAITQFAFLAALSSAEFVLNYTKPLSVLLQKSGLDLCVASREVTIIQETLNDVRLSADERFADVYANIIRLGTVAGIEPSTPRVCGKQTHRSNVPARTAESYYRTSVFLPFVDSMIQGLEDRFTRVHQDIALSSKLVPSVLIKSVRINEAEIHSLEKAFPDMPDPRSFSSEYDRWHKMWQLEKSSATQVCGFTDSLKHADADLFPNIRLVMQVTATRLSSTASAERSFSGLKRLKTYLRCSMLEDRLSALALLHIHQDISVPVDEIIDRFARLGPHRLAYL